MVKSMTGYGRAEETFNGCTITVELRSVNNRYLDCNVRIPRLYLFAEEAIKSRVQSSISRGKVDVFVTLDSAGAERVQVSVNRPVADGYYAALKQLAEEYGLAGDISVSLLSRFPEVLLAEKAEEDVEEMAGDICSVLDQALRDFDQMRTKEGERLKEDILSRAAAIEEKVSLVEKRSPQTVAEYRAKLEARMNEVLSNTQLDPARILTEAAIFADKVAVDEETVRLRSHIGQLRGMLSKGGATGRKLDFLIQEFNREANTIGSKCSDIEIAGQVVDIKAEIEKIREQVQNIE
ncbi:MAG: YicC family protein [Lawsonibacter sp.]|nr:YicC family protein [Lawsonibacter sp.]MCI9027926.1 YicC family protein [Lawsonibacter sp.]MCI9654557.1 YicC family protein [Lawsonibacter sp.]